MKTTLEWLGLALVAVGVALWSIPAGLIVAGVLLVLEVNFGADPDEDDDAAEEPGPGGV